MSDDYKYEFHHTGAELLSKQELDVISDDEVSIQDTHFLIPKHVVTPFCFLGGLC